MSFIPAFSISRREPNACLSHTYATAHRVFTPQQSQLISIMSYQLPMKSLCWLVVTAVSAPFLLLLLLGVFILSALIWIVSIASYRMNMYLWVWWASFHSSIPMTRLIVCAWKHFNIIRRVIYILTWKSISCHWLMDRQLELMTKTKYAPLKI